MDRIGIIFIILFFMFVLQSFGAFMQVTAYRKAIERCRSFGNLGIGQKKSRFFIIRGNIVIIGCDKDGVITGCEIMEGATVLARFRVQDRLLGRSMIGETIWDYLAEFRAMDKKKQKFYKGYMQAMEALEMRLRHKEEEVVLIDQNTGEKKEIDIDAL